MSINRAALHIDHQGITNSVHWIELIFLDLIERSNDIDDTLNPWEAIQVYTNSYVI